LLHWKGFHLGIRAFLQANITNAEYWILGDGPEQLRLQAMVDNNNAGDRVKIWGRVPRPEVLLKLATCHVLVHPSLHDSGGLVCLEAMASGRPVICLDLGGPAIQVIAETGIKVPAIDPQQTVRDLAVAMNTLAHDSDLRSQMGKAAKRRVNEVFTWDIKGRYFSELYRKIAADSRYTTRKLL
jgi:glycosyltransferase involved in cell wall biosynthesis